MERWPAGFRYRRVFEGPTVRISRWRCQSVPPRLGPERCQPQAIMVFLHSGNFRVHSSAKIGLLDSTRIGFFNAGVPFQSAHPFGGGDSGSDLAVRPDVLTEILVRYDSRACPEEPFSRGFGPCEPASFLLHRLILRKASDGNPADALEIEERSLDLVDRLAKAACGVASPTSSPRPSPREREQAEELRGLLSSNPGGTHRLDALARRLDSTPFCLCRSFRAVTGTTIHRYLTRVRLQRALGRLTEGAEDLTGLAFDLGFSSHSHFTAVFRRAIGATPEAVRRAANGRDISGVQT